jgi:hypothetical protein
MTRRDVAYQLLLVSAGALLAALVLAIVRGQQVPVRPTVPAPTSTTAPTAPTLRVVKCPG